VITDFAFFSNRALRLSVEVELGSLPRFRAALERASVILFDRCVEELAKTEKSLLESAKLRPVVVMLHVAFLAEDAPQPSAHA